MPLRVEAGDDLAGNWLEVVERWTNTELALYNSLSGEPFIELWTKKVVACHIEVEGGEPITDPAQVWPRYGDIDIRLSRFITRGVLSVTEHLKTLGETTRRLSLPGAVAGPTDRK